MASIIGHALFAAAAARSPAMVEPGAGRLFSAPVTMAAVALAVLPDLDIVAWMAFRVSGLSPHRGVSHSLVVGAALALVAWLVVIKWEKRGRGLILVALLLAAAMHPLLDYLMGCGPRVPLFWPISSRTFLSPAQLIPTAYYASSMAGYLSILKSPLTWTGIWLEFAIAGPILLAESNRRRGRGPRYWLIPLLASAIAVFAVYYLYS